MPTRAPGEHPACNGALSGIGAVLVTKAAADTMPAPATAPRLSADPRPALR
ncbi:hypothetical protein ACF08M_10895 [Streptomyces sp. NPDC015032]|uniref:hypothetical protein n=1 Tax=Streptomyces sp. NPDC015032 TaxID=3364937 RepID=UPI0036FF0A77